MTIVTESELIVGAKQGKVISFPTDTVPAMAVLPAYSELIYQIKGRSLDKSLILMGASPEALWPYILGTETELAIWQDVASKYWPGQLTLVLPASHLVPLVMHPNDSTSIGLRVPNHPIAQKILAQTTPLATTSANISGKPPLSNLSEIESTFPNVLISAEHKLAQTIDFFSNVPSTVAKWTDYGWQILRQGQIKL